MDPIELGMISRRTLSVALMGFASGLPLVLIGSTLQAWYTMAGVSITTIGALTLIGMPYLYKFLWAPLFDRYNPLSFDRRRSWILLTQLFLTLGLITMAFLNPAHCPWALASVALVVGFFSASQDTVIDAYKTDVLTQEERGLGVAFAAMGYRSAMLVAGAFALILAAEMGWRFTYLCMAFLMLIEMLVTMRSPRLAHVTPPKSFLQAVREPFVDFFTSRTIMHAILILIFIAIYKISEALSLSLNSYFLLKGVGFTLVEVGSVSKLALLCGGVFGSLIAGVLLPRWSLYFSLILFGFLQMSSNLAFILLLVFGKSLFLLGSVMFVESFCSGMGTVAFIVFIMGLCNKKFTATQYALLSAVSALGRVLLGPIAAVMVKHMGWGEFYVWTFVMGIPALIILSWLNRQKDFVLEASF